MRIAKKTISAALALCMLAVFPTTYTQAAAPKVVVDETAYLMLDYYGALDNYSIVKGCDLNGNTQFKDYGSYSSVTNMSTLDAPQQSDKSVTWNLDSGADNRFYYEVVPQKQTFDTLPWTVDVSYKLNGVPAHADKLAGASGLITVDVTATPNPNANAYYRDNFILVCGMASDTSKNTSFSAEGAQFQSFGSYQMAFFIAMPKREGEFSFQIGSDSFETQGVILAMMPATMSQLDDISEMKEHKTNIEDASNAMDQTVADILDMLSAMSGGMGTTIQGLNKLDQARAAMDKDSDGVTQSVSKLRSSLKEMEKGLNNYAEFLGDAKLSNAVSGMGNNAKSIAEIMGKMGGDVEDIYKLMSKLKIAILEFKDESTSSARKQELVSEIALLTGELETALYYVDSSAFASYVKRVESSVKEIESLAGKADGASDDVVKQAAGAMLQELQTINATMSGMVADSEKLSGSIGGSIGDIYALSGEMEDILEETSRVMDDAADLMKDTRGMLDSVDTMLSDSSDLLNEGAQVSIAGITQMLNDLLGVLHKTDNLQANRETISNIIRDEWHRLDDDFGVLDIDTSADKVSLTSSKNAPPRSLQIIMRTHEIELPEEDEQPSAEQEEAESTVGARIVRVFKVIKDGLAELFK
ncbi:MAG: hypothetical protein K0S22_1658 [Oscillospiraceae bacterium]|jgi:ABC-type transporter Mla subunit MlaD|nr:hypothetical protein [Oscillospiraceae bacterium]